MHKERFLGVSVLALLFFASALFSWSFFANAPRPSEVEAAARTSEAAATVASLASPPNAFASVAITAKSAFVLDLTDNTVLYALDPDTQWPLASLTKVPLVLAVTQALPADTIITMPEGVPQFKAGTHWKLQDIVDYTLAVSSNEGADVLAQAGNDAIAGTYTDAPPSGATVWRMNQLAHQLGLSNTYFLNDNGLDESTTQSGAYGTARDMATLFAYAASTSPATFSATTLQSFSIQSIDGARATAINTDEALPSIHGIIMGKTGYTTLAEGNLAVVFDSGGHRVVAVVLGSTQTGRFDDMKTLVALTDQTIAAAR